jgi:hypothetical protein
MTLGLLCDIFGSASAPHHAADLTECSQKHNEMCSMGFESQTNVLI